MHEVAMLAWNAGTQGNPRATRYPIPPQVAGASEPGRTAPNRLLRLASIVIAAAIALGSTAIGQAGQVVGELELAAPTVSDFILHGTLPVPKDTFPRTDGKLPFAIANWNGVLVGAQVEPVTWYPDLADGADVVEVIARVQLPSGTQPGTRVRYSIVHQPHAPTSFANSNQVDQLLTGSKRPFIRTRDVFGNSYQAELVRGLDGIKTLRSGPFRLQRRLYEVMRPTTSNGGPPTGPLDRMMGVHAYVGTWSGEDVVSIDLRIHNGTSGHDKADPIDDPQGDLYFTALEIVVPNPWSLLLDIPDTGAGTPYNEGPFTVYPIVKPQVGGKLNVLPSQAQFERRMVLYAPQQSTQQVAASLVRSEWIGFCQPGASGTLPHYSWWNRQTPRYFPQCHVLPRFDHMGKAQTLAKLRTQYYDDVDWLKSGVAKGSYPYESDQLGWAYPFGVKYGGMTGGSDIYLYDGVLTAWAASWEGYRHAQLFHRGYLDRHPVALFDKDGDPTTLADWVVHGSQFDYVNMQFFLTLLGGFDPFGFDLAPVFHKLAVILGGKQPSYEAELLSYKPIDIQHHIRVLRSHKVLTWLGNDAMAKDDLMMSAELLRLSYHGLPNHSSGSYVGNGMLADLVHVAVDPGAGFTVGRGEAWTIDGMLAAYAIAGPAWRATARPWFDQVATLLRDGQMSCSGFLMRLVTNKDFNGHFAVRRSTETAMLEHAMLGMIETVYRGVDTAKHQMLESVLVKSLYAMIAPPSWDSSQGGPISSIAVAPNSGAPYCGASPAVAPDVDTFQSWCSLAYGYEITADKIFLQRAAEMSNAPSWQSLLHAQENLNFANHENRAALLALAQMLFD